MWTDRQKTADLLALTKKLVTEKFIFLQRVLWVLEAKDPTSV